jgi:hypothetical protein
VSRNRERAVVSSTVCSLDVKQIREILPCKKNNKKEPNHLKLSKVFPLSLNVTLWEISNTDTSWVLRRSRITLPGHQAPSLPLLTHSSYPILNPIIVPTPCRLSAREFQVVTTLWLKEFLLMSSLSFTPLMLYTPGTPPGSWP